MSKTPHRLNPEAAFGPIVDQMQTLSRELFEIRERAHANCLDLATSQTNAPSAMLKTVMRLLKARFESFERRLRGTPRSRVE